MFDFINENYVKNDIKIFPLIENGKTPYINAWQNNCSTDIKQIFYWLKECKCKCNIGMPANENNLFIIDIDMHGVDGLESFNKLCGDLKIDLPKTLRQTTPSGGIHYIFKSDEELKKVMNSANCFKDYQGIDIRTKGYVAVEPSIINGKTYKLDRTYEISELPKELRDFILNNNNKYQSERKENGYIKPKKVEKGGRDNAVFDYMCMLYRTTRLDKEDITLLSYNFNQSICEPPLNTRDIDYKINRLFNQDRNKFILVKIGEMNSEL